MPDFNELKNKATDAFNTAKASADGFMTDHAGEIDAAKAAAGDLVGKVGAAAAGVAGKAVDKAEELSGQDLDGDGVVGANPEKAAAEAGEGGSFFDKVAGAAGSVVNKVEGVTGVDLDGDGTVAGAAAAEGDVVEAAEAEVAEEANVVAEEVAEAEAAVEEVAAEAPEIPGETFTA